jgi:hypothetical protein
MKLLKNKRFFRCIALGLMVATSFLSVTSETRAQAIGSTDIDITLPDIVILHYFGSVSVEITPANMAAFLGLTTAVQETVSVTPLEGFDVDLQMSPSAPTGSLDAAILTLRNAWAVRSLSLGPGGNSGTTSLDISIGNDTLVHDSLGGGTEIILDAATVNVTGGGAGSASINFDSPGLFSPQLGDVQLTLDMRDATAAGTYLGGVFTLEATIP